MRRAIAISAQGLGSTSPNPPVGCVILDSDGRMVSEGYHVRKGEAHAEFNALTAAGKLADGGTALVTLEPCNHHGRTPPCREALINAKVARVVIAVMDPTSRGEGGAALLRKAGVQVEQDVLRDEALLVLGPWLDSVRSDRPFVTWIFEAGPPHGRCAVIRHENLRESHDLVVRPDGEITEGRPGNHGRGVFHVPSSLGGTAVETLGVLRESGARSILLEGLSSCADVLSAAGAVDQVVVYLPDTPHSWAPPGQVTAIPDGYRLTAATRDGDHVRLVGRR